MFTTSRLSWLSQLHDDITVSVSYLGQAKIFLGLRGDGEEGHRNIEQFFFFLSFFCPLKKIFNWRAIYSGFFPCFPLCVMCFAGVLMMKGLQSNSSHPAKVKWRFRAQANSPQTAATPLDSKEAKRYLGFHQKIAYGSILFIKLSLIHFPSLDVWSLQSWLPSGTTWKDERVATVSQVPNQKLKENPTTL